MTHMCNSSTLETEAEGLLVRNFQKGEGGGGRGGKKKEEEEKRREMRRRRRVMHFWNVRMLGPCVTFISRDGLSPDLSATLLKANCGKGRPPRLLPKHLGGDGEQTL